MKKQKKSISVKCCICNHEAKDSAAFSSHLRSKHNITTDEDRLNYVLQFDDLNYYCETGDGTLKEFKRAILSPLPLEEKCYRLSQDKYQFVKKLAGKFDKFRVLADYLFLDLKLTQETITREIVNENKSKFSSTSLEYFLKKTDGDLEKAKKLLIDRQSTTSKKSFIKRFGEEEGLKKFDNHFNNIHSQVKGQSYNTLESFIQKYGNDEGIRKFRVAKELGAHTLENFIRRDGELEGTVKYEKWKQSTARTLENFQKTYGIEEGTERYKNYRSNFGGAFGEASKESLLIFEPITKYLTELGFGEELYYGANGKKEYFLYDSKNDNFYLYDFTIRSAKIIIEYNGLTYHPCKSRLTESEWKNWKEPYSRMSADEKFEKDQAKINFARKQGFKVLEIWSDSTPEENIKIIETFLKVNLEL